MVAKQELPLERWSDLLSLIDQLSHSQDTTERLVCTYVHGTGMEFYIMFTLVKLCLSGGVYFVLFMMW